MPKPNGTRKDLAFSLATIRASLPGCKADVARRSGFSPQTVGRIITRLIKDRKAYQSGWTECANKWVPEYSAGRKPTGFVLPECPVKDQAERNRKWKAEQRKSNPAYRERVKKEQAATRKRRRANNPAYAERERKRKADYYQANKDRLNEERRERKRATNTRPGRRFPNSADLAHANQLLQLTDPKGIGERLSRETIPIVDYESEEDDELADLG